MDEFKNFDEQFDDAPDKPDKGLLSVKRAKDKARGIWAKDHLESRALEKRQKKGETIGRAFLDKCTIELSKFDNERFCFPEYHSGTSKKLRLKRISNAIILDFYTPGWFASQYPEIHYQVSFSISKFNLSPSYTIGKVGRSGSVIPPPIENYDTEEKSFEALEALLIKYLEI